MKNNPWISLAILSAVTFLAACGGPQGLIGGGSTGSSLLSVTISPSNPTLALSVSPAPPTTTQFVATGTYSFGNPQDISKQVAWSTTDPKVVTIDGNGVATAVGSGRAYVSAQIQDPVTGKLFTPNTILAVVPQLTAIMVTPASATIAHGTSQQFTATGKFNDNSSVDITSQVAWISSQPGFAIISGSPGTQGLTNGVAAGTVNITAQLGTLVSSPSVLTVSNANLVGLAANPGTATVPLATVQQLAAMGSFDDGTQQDISGDVVWSSSASATARISQTGAVAGTGIGSAAVTATFGSQQGSALITVDASSVNAVNVLPVTTIATGTHRQMRAIGAFADGGSLEVTNTPGITWSSSSSGVATVDPAAGLALGVGPGAAKITATLGSKSGSSTLNVSHAAIQSLAIAPAGATIAQQGIQSLAALGTFSNGTTTFQQEISTDAAWGSQDPGFATVSNPTGFQELAMGVASGSTQINAAFSAPAGGNASASAPLTVNTAQLNSISLKPGSAAIPLGGGQQFSASGNFSDGSHADLTLAAIWSSQNAMIATVSPVGYANASRGGQTSVGATFGSLTGSSNVLINPAALVAIDICAATVSQPLVNCPPLDPFPPPLPISFAMQAPFGLIAIGTYSDGSRADLTTAVHWSSSQAAVATASNDPGSAGFTTGVARQGVVTGNQAGTVNIKAAIGSTSGSTQVTVTGATLQLLTVSPPNSTIALGTTQQCSVTVTFSDNTTQDITPYVEWTTSNPNVVIVQKGGIAYSAGKGTSTITVEFNGGFGSTTLTVQ